MASRRKSRVAEVYLQLRPSMDGFFSEVDRSTSKGLTDSAVKGGKAWGNGFTKAASSSLKGLVTSVAAASVLAVTGATIAISKGIANASDLSENMGAVQSVFGDAAAAVEKFSLTTAKQLGISQNQALSAAKDFGIFGKVAGFTGTDLSNFSEKMTTLASDLSSFGNTSPEEALNALSAGLRGESEPLRKYGILLDDAQLRQKALELGIYDGNGALSSQQRIMAAQAVIFAQSATQQGAFARESGGFSGKLAIFNARLEDISTQLGKVFLPVAIFALTQFNDRLVPLLNNMITAFGPSMGDKLINFTGYLVGLAEGTAKLPQPLVDTWSAIGKVSSVLGDAGLAIVGFINGTTPLPQVLQDVVDIGEKLWVIGERWVEIFLTVAPVLLDAANIIANFLAPALNILVGFVSQNTELLTNLIVAWFAIKGIMFITTGILVAYNVVKSVYNAITLLAIARTYGLAGAEYAFAAGSKASIFFVGTKNTLLAISNGLTVAASGIMTFFTTTIWGNSVAWIANTANVLRSRIMGNLLLADLIKTTAWVWAQRGAIASLALAWARNAAAMLVQKGIMLASLAWLGLVTIAQWAWNAAITANPIGLIILGVVALIAGIIWLATQTTFFQDVWRNLTSFIGDSIKNIGGWLGKVGEGFAVFFGGVSDVIVTILKNIGNFFIGIVNGIINGINFVIGIINSIKIPIPDWAKSFFGGKNTIGFNIGKMTNIPALATGANVMGPTVALVGEKKPETVTDLGQTNRFIASTLKLVENASSGQTGSEAPVYITVNPSVGMSEAELAKKVGKAVQKARRR